MIFHVFWNIFRKKIEMLFFSKKFSEIKHPFFTKSFTSISQIFQKLLNISSRLFLFPLERLLQTAFVLKKKSQKTSHFFSINFYDFLPKKALFPKTT